MITETSQPTHHKKGITLPITTEFRLVAERFAHQCPFPEKAEQIRRNTLAVCAVNAYLQLMDIATEIEKSDSWNPMMQMLANVADLKVPNVGVFSCRAIAPTDDTCYIPAEDWHKRAGYIAVAIDQTAQQATLIGFTPTVNEIDQTTEQLSLAQFAPIEALIDTVHSLHSSAASAASGTSLVAPARTLVTQLAQWTQGTIDRSWQAIDALINPTDLSVAFRTDASSNRSLNRASAMNISRAKLVDLGLQLDSALQVALIIHLTETSRELSPEKLRPRSDIILQVHPLGDSPYLPKGVCLSIFDENDQLFRKATSRSIDNYIQIQITGESGETFSVQISKGEATFKEQFVI
jgi:HPt (histidine-containing phosphotransfer) domain-containing protein